jgi:predicted acetyltransferase
MTAPWLVRPIEASEVEAFIRAANLAFGDQSTAEEVETSREELEPERALVAVEAGEIVGTIAGVTMDLTLPGNRVLPIGGLSWGGVLPTHRRRGLLRLLMTTALDAVAERGEALAAFLSSESQLYARYGSGPATSGLGIEIERAHAGFLQQPHAPGRTRLAEGPAAEALLPIVYDQFRMSRPGSLSRSAAWWKVFLADQERYRMGAGPRFYAVHDNPLGQPDGYVAYRVKEDWDHGLANFELIVEECITRDPEVHAELWHYCLNTDLVSTITCANVPLDEPLRWLLEDSRRMRVVHLIDGLWIRILDVCAALSSRRYEVEEALVLRVHDRLRPEGEGTYELAGGTSEAVCRRTERSPDLEIDIAHLGAAYLGGVAFSTLASAGFVREVSRGALARADRMFASRPAPWSVTEF